MNVHVLHLDTLGPDTDAIRRARLETSLTTDFSDPNSFKICFLPTTSGTCGLIFKGHMHDTSVDEIIVREKST